MNLIINKLGLIEQLNLNEKTKKLQINEERSLLTNNEY